MGDEVRSVKGPEQRDEVQGDGLQCGEDSKPGLFFGQRVSTEPVPALAIVLGSLGYHKSYVYPMAYVVFGALWYTLFSNGTLRWLIPYLIAVVLFLANKVRPFKPGVRLEVVFHSFMVTMCELVTLNIGSISILHLPGALWMVITPFMFLERSVAVVGATSVLLALIRVRGVLRMGDI